MTGLMAADGSYNVTVVDGATRTGLMAANGSYNVVQDTSTTARGIFHACGAFNVKVVTSGIKAHYSANGTMNVCVSPYTVTGAVPVTVVAGSFV